ncbi:hypothetical protein B0T19DRAFT_362336 [Cercophora scortea]|uniref:VOC domain-containing protein n=1 Tax=Cercophora scortea TaxID=314031 RepID=A0AAE0I7K7_9PEZI|nr:hypothetical protein B0T19DRAFT_362336 [Cercophora scortea]
MLPFLEVEHLPSSSSFYSAVLQPLGLRYLSTEDDGHFPSILYGTSPRDPPVFQLRQIHASRDRPLRISRIALSAPSAEATADVYAFAVRANPDIQDSSYPRHYSATRSASGVSASQSIGGGGEKRVKITDYDGNIMDVVFCPPPEYPPHYSGSTVRHTQSTDDEAVRILHWNYDIATSLPHSSSGPGSVVSGASNRTATRRPYADASRDDHYRLRRSVTSSSSVYEPTASPRKNSQGISTSTVVGTLLGVAAGATLVGGVLYGMTRNDRSRSSRDEFDAPPFSRRSTFPEPYPDRADRSIPAERPTERVRYSEAYAPVSDYRFPPEYPPRYSQASAPRSREVEDLYEDTRGRQSAPRSRASVRTRSEISGNRQPLLIEDTEHRSYVSSKSSRHPPSVQRSYTYESPEHERYSYVSARSHRSSATLRAAPPPMPTAPSQHLVSRSRTGSRVTTTTIKVGGSGSSQSPRTMSRSGNTYISARDIPLPASGVGTPAGTYVSARHVPLPSGVGTNWEEPDDDADSIAPSDSISCVGSRRSGRSYRH